MRFLALLLLPLLLNSCHIGRSVIRVFADENDYKFFPSRTIRASDKPFYFIEAIDTTIGDRVIIEIAEEKTPLNQYLSDSPILGFMVIRNDSILYEQYYRGYNKESTVTSFSMAKSFISTLIGIAIDEGFIKNIREPVTNYIQELDTGKGFEKITIEHLLRMTSGLRFGEGYFSPFSDVAKFYYGRRLDRYIRQSRIREPPGTDFDYQSNSTQMLGMILQRATGKSVSEYMEEKLWSRIGTESDATWSIDRKGGMEKAFCCINGKARDFARFGRLLLREGNWEGEQVVPGNWVKESTKADKSNGSTSYYQYQWWVGRRGHGDFYARGLYGQIIHIFPREKVLIVRFAKRNFKGGIPLKVHYDIIGQLNNRTVEQ